MTRRQRPRVVITGIGMVSPLGASYNATLEALSRGQSAIAPLTLFDATGFVQQQAAEVRTFEAREYFRVPKAMKLTDRTTRFAVAAAAMALQDAEWPVDEPGDRLGVVIGSSGSDLQARELARALEADADLRSVDDIPFFADRILSGLNPLWLLVNLPNMPSSHVGIQLGARGPNNTIMTDWVAGSQAIGEAADWIRDGDADAVLAGGADTALQPFAYASYEQTAVLTDVEPGRPGFIPAEGAAVLLLEDCEHAQQRGARIRAEVIAYSTASSALASGDNALTRTMTTVLEEAGWRAGDVTALAPAAVFAAPFAQYEQAAVEAVWGNRRALPRRLDFRSNLGHALAATGPLDLALALGVEADQSRMLCNSIGYSGQAATIAVQHVRPNQDCAGAIAMQ